jgi:hypothetical protein
LISGCRVIEVTLVLLVLRAAAMLGVQYVIIGTTFGARPMPLSWRRRSLPRQAASLLSVPPLLEAIAECRVLMSCFHVIAMLRFRLPSAGVCLPG